MRTSCTYVHMQMKNVLSSFRHTQFDAPQKTKSCVYRRSNSCIFLHEITKILFYAHFAININQSINQSIIYL